MLSILTLKGGGDNARDFSDSRVDVPLWKSDLHTLESTFIVASFMQKQQALSVVLVNMTKFNWPLGNVTVADTPYLWEQIHISPEAEFLLAASTFPLEMGAKGFLENYGNWRSGIKEGFGKVCKMVPGGGMGSITSSPHPTVRWTRCYCASWWIKIQPQVQSMSTGSPTRVSYLTFS